MKKIILLSAALLALNVNAQVLTQITSPSGNLPGWGTMNQRSNVTLDTRLSGDISGDNIDDIFWAYHGNLGNQASYDLRILGSTGTGSFATYYNNSGTSMPLNGGGTIDLLNENNFVLGNFTTSLFFPDAMEVLSYSDDALSTPTDKSHLLRFTGNTPPTVLMSNNNGYIGDAKIWTFYQNNPYRTKFYAANLTNDKYDELFSVENNGSGTITLRIQRYINGAFSSVWSTTTGNFSGLWNVNFANDEYIFADVNPWNNTTGNVKKEIICINRTTGWLKILDYNESTNSWNLDYSNGGNSNVYSSPSGANTYPFNGNTVFLAGNFDISDFHAEILVCPRNSPSQIRAIQFDYATGTMMNITAPSINTTGMEGSYYGATPYVTPIERVGSFNYPRNFYTKTIQHPANNIKYLTGNFYTTTGNTNLELILFYTSITFVPTGFTNNGIFTTDCAPQTMYGCQYGAVSCFNLNNQLLNVYDRVGDKFDATQIFNPTQYAMYSSNNGQNLRENNNNSFSQTNSAYPNPVINTLTIEINEIENDINSTIQIFDINGKRVDAESYQSGKFIFVNCSGLSNGIYFYEVMNGTYSNKGKFIVKSE
ncbi:MAG: T9SS type A sorting domain-containing protein [Bacteroidia bacterium]|jgi:hypothetical protein|nr:T9SS type A sorting domain-containing protein [Bacteroidia bacterium]